MERKITTDSFLWDEFRSGNDKAFSKIYEIFVDVLYRYCMKFTSDEELVKDCIQEFFVDIYESRQRLGSTDNIKFYMLKSIKRRLFILLRTQGVHASLSQTEMPFNILYAPNDEMYTEEQINHKQKAVQQALAELTPRQKEAIYLRYMSMMTYEEICQIMDMNYQSARNLIFRAVEKMRVALAQTNLTLFLILRHC